MSCPCPRTVHNRVRFIVIYKRTYRTYRRYIHLKHAPTRRETRTSCYSSRPALNTLVSIIVFLFQAALSAPLRRVGSWIEMRVR